MTVNSRTATIVVLLGTVVSGCQPRLTRHDSRTSTASLKASAKCATQEEVLQRIADAATSGELALVIPLVATADDLLKIQRLKPASQPDNRAALNSQMVHDVNFAIIRFRDTFKPTRLTTIRKGEFRSNAAIENLAPSVDQLRDSQIQFRTERAATGSLNVGMLIRVGGCWKILFM